MSVEIRLGASMTPAIRARVGAWCDSTMKDDVHVTNREPLRTIDLGSLPAIVSATVSVITFLINVWPKHPTWTEERLRSVTAEALLKRGIIDFDVIGLAGYGALSDASGGQHCTVEVRDKGTGSTYKIAVRRDGDAFVIDI